MVQMKIKKPSKARRVFASLFDFMIALILFFVMYAMVINPLFNNNTNLKTITNEYYNNLSETRLYSYSSSTSICTVVEPEFSEDKEIVAHDYVDFYDSRIKQYFEENDQKDEFDNLKDNSNYFSKVEGEWVLNENVKAEDAKDFYLNAISVATRDIFMKVEENIKLKNKIDMYSNWMLITASLPAFLIVYVGVPFLLDGGQTIGKKALNLKVASTQTGFKLKWSTLLLRQLLVVIVGYLMGIFTYFISTIAFLLTFLFTKDSKSIEDFLCNTIVYENVAIEEPSEDEESEEDSSILTIELKEIKKEVKK